MTTSPTTAVQSLLLLESLMELDVSFLHRRYCCLSYRLSTWSVWPRNTVCPTTMERFICWGQEVPHDPSPSTSGTGSPRRKKQKMKHWLTSQLASVQQYSGLEDPFCPRDCDLLSNSFLVTGPQALSSFPGDPEGLRWRKRGKRSEDRLWERRWCLS